MQKTTKALELNDPRQKMLRTESGWAQNRTRILITQCPKDNNLILNAPSQQKLITHTGCPNTGRGPYAGLMKTSKVIR